MSIKRLMFIWVSERSAPSTKQPDKFERAVDCLIHGSYPTADTCVTRDEAVTLIRQYHKEVVEVVKGERLPASCCHNSDFEWTATMMPSRSFSPN